MLPAFINGWDATTLKARIAFGRSEITDHPLPEDIDFGAVHQGSGLRHARAGPIGNVAPLLAGGGIVLGDSGADPG